MKRPLIALLTLVLVSACCEPPQPRNVVVTCVEGEDAGVAEPFESDQTPEALGLATPCARACKSLSNLGCPESVKLPAGKTCVETCKAIASISSFDPECVAASKSVAAVRKCPQIKCKQ